MSYQLLKRLVDVAVASCVLFFGAPLMLLVAILVRLQLGSPILFSQDRPGMNGEIFTLLKFRSMREGEGSDAERMTAFGRTLRATSLDELPSMINVVRGDMSLVGPRPLLIEYLPLYSDRQATRHDVRPGITGLAQTSGRNLLSWEDRLELDAQYVESASLRTDLRILGQTVGKVIAREGVSADGEATMSKFEGS